MTNLFFNCTLYHCPTEHSFGNYDRIFVLYCVLFLSDDCSETHVVIRKYWYMVIMCHHVAANCSKGKQNQHDDPDFLQWFQ